MKTVEIIGFHRNDLRKKASRDMRREAMVPCVLYGGEKVIHFCAPMILFREIVYTPDVYQVNLDIEGDMYTCVLQDVQFHPVNEIILHADFLQLFEDKPVKLEIPVRFIGTSPGVQKGGKLMAKLNKLKVKALPKDLPEYIEVSIEGLELGKSVKVKDIKPDNYEILNSISNPVASIEIPRALRSKQGAAAADAE